MESTNDAGASALVSGCGDAEQRLNELIQSLQTAKLEDMCHGVSRRGMAKKYADIINII